jgi:putative flippase GtrA
MKKLAVKGKALAARYAQFLKFNAVGLLNTLVDMLIFSALVAAGVPALWSQCVSYGAGMANSFLLNKYWTFGGSKTAGNSQFIRFVVINGVTLGLSLLLLHICTTSLGMRPIPAKVAVTFLTMLVNFAGSKLWVFREDKRTEA